MQPLEGRCPNEKCGSQIFFISPVGDNKVECPECKELHNENEILEQKDAQWSMLEFLQNIRKLKAEQIKKKSESIKIKGLSNYSCKLISPLLTKYGLDKNTHKVKLLSTMGQGEVFDCSHLCNRAFMIERENLHIPEYGLDESAEYLKDTLQEIWNVNGNEERLVPIYADGDGHCLLHAISRSLIGHELFWHPLLTNLKEHFTKKKSDYKALLGDFIQDSEWTDIIKEADPNYLPAYGETHGLRNIHVFGLSNVLHRPIILIDSLQGMRSKGDYSAVFLPALIPKDRCRNSDGVYNNPIVIAWSSKGHNHFVPLVGIKGKPVPKYPCTALPKVWGLPQELLFEYVQFENGACIIGGAKTLSDSYLKKLINAMSNHYLILNGVSPSIVADCYQHIYKPSGVVGMTAQMITEAAFALVREERLHRCLSCYTVTQHEPPCPLSWLEPGGKLFDIAIKTHGSLKNGYHYKFPYNGNIVCSYDSTKNRLLIVQDLLSLKCPHCGGTIRLVKRDGTLVYYNGDQLSVPASSSSHCGCGFKHYWDGKEYDNLPSKIPVTFEWEGKKREDIIYWFQNESDTSLNSNAFDLAQKVVHKHFPGEFGSERVVQKVVDQIFRETTKFKPKLDEKKSPAPPVTSTTAPSTKIILTGAKSAVLHKEELNASKTEQIIRQKVEHGAALKQKRLSSSPIKTSNIDTSPSKMVNVETSPIRNVASAESKAAEGDIKNERKESKVRICTSDGSSCMYTITENTSFDDLQSVIEDKFSVAKDVQIIKYGFPPKALLPEEGDVSKPLKLQHGERLVVHTKKVQKTQVLMEVDTDTVNSVSTSVPHGSFDNNVASSRTLSSFEMNQTVKRKTESEESLLASSFISLLESVNLWSWACTQRELFQPGGIFYKQAVQDLRTLSDNKHFSLPCFPNKLFVFSARNDEIYLCLGKQHVPVRILSKEEETLADQQVQEAKAKHPMLHKEMQAVTSENENDASISELPDVSRKKVEKRTLSETESDNSMSEETNFENIRDKPLDERKDNND